MEVPKVNAIDLAFGNIDHMPNYADLPDSFRNWYREPHCEAISTWFALGAKPYESGIEIGGERYAAREGVDRTAALAAIKAVLASWTPKHEHKIAACGYMLSQWFEKVAKP
ncbi:MAG: hypothetical protein H0T60_10360 [Acidobacteria bacterium]|nr:hypothetical protein [Acidobacteriota bacterium]